MNTKIFRYAVLGLLICSAVAEARAVRDLYSDTWVGVDALGRVLPTAAECGTPKDNKTIGLFYFLWLGQHTTSGPHDITDLLRNDPNHPAWGPPGAFHHWGRPELGYYTSSSDYVIRQHARMLEAAGVDTLIFDVTNAFTYPDIYENIGRIYTDLRAAGQHTPQLMFLTHSRSEATITKLYHVFYAKNHYPDLWFRWKGKPLILGNPETLDPVIRDFFTIRDCWAWTHGKDTWQWLDHYPQRYGWHESDLVAEEMSVCVAEHPVSNIGRSHHNGQQPTANAIGVCADTGKGLYFQQQWDRALQVSPEFVFITGWNEWVAQRFIKESGLPPAALCGNPLAAGDSYFVDAYTQEYSRDIEPMEGGCTDNYYYQMIANIRKYKGVRPLPTASAPTTIVIDGAFDDWHNVGPEFRDFRGDTEYRADDGWGKAGPYVNTTGRNDFVTLKVARDKETVYFYAETAGTITPPSNDHWMMLFIDTDRDPLTGWAGYDAVTNLEIDDGTTASLHLLKSSEWHPDLETKIRFAVNKNQLELAIPRRLLGSGTDPLTFDFHWADNIQTVGDVLEFSRSGDAAPDRRFNYRYLADRP